MNVDFTIRQAPEAAVPVATVPVATAPVATAAVAVGGDAAWKRCAASETIYSLTPQPSRISELVV